MYRELYSLRPVCRASTCVCVCFFFLFSFFLMAQIRLSVKTQTQEGVSSANKLSSLKGIYYLLLAFIVHFFSLANLLVVDLSFFSV